MPMLDRNARYKHLLPVDATIWRKHHLTHAADYHTLEYDIHVGEGRDPGPEFPDNIRSMAIALSERRIDVVARGRSSTDIIEVTHSAGFTALGQLIAYPVLYAIKHPNAGPVRPVLVAGKIQSDIKPVLEKLQIRFYEYGAPESLPEPRSPRE